VAHTLLRSPSVRSAPPHRAQTARRGPRVVAAGRRCCHGLILLAGLFDPVLDPREVSDAIAVGQSRSEADRARFHLPYRLLVNRAPIDYIDVVTPFRRVVLAAEARRRTGDRPFTQRDGLEIVGGPGGRLQLVVELTFHPLNTFIGVPPYVVVLVPAGSTGGAIAPVDLERIPRHGPRIDGVTPGAPIPAGPSGRQEPVLGGAVIASFDAAAVNQNGRYDVVVSESGKEGVRVRLNLATVR
jgi:hypothetical protein